MRFRGLVLFVLSSLCFAVTGADWPQWRGPFRTGHVPESSRKMDRLPERSSEIWKIRIGEGFASPVLASNHLVCFDNQRGKETIHSLDPKNGKERWAVAIDDTFQDQQGPPGPRCTPLIDGERVYAQSCKGELQCLDLSTGRVLWRANYVKDFNAVFIGEKGNTPGAARHGNNGSPVIAGDRLFACAGGTNGAGMVCFDKRTGAVIWKSQKDQAAYAPPIVAVVAGVEQMICFTVEGAVGLNAADGALLWRVPIKTAFARHVTTPVVFEDMVAVASHEVGLVGIKVVKTASGIVATRAWTSKQIWA